MKYIILSVGIFFINAVMFSQTLDDYVINGGISSIEGDYNLGDIFVVENLTHRPLEKERTIIAYPNPFKNTIFILPSEKIIDNKIMIYDTLGRLVSEELLIDNKVILTNLPSGIYFLNFRGNEFETIKIIKI